MLRERNRIATRDAIANAAIRLAKRCGLEKLRVEDIAREAGVSTRTFSNYFSNKYEALTARHVDTMHHVAKALQRRPAKEPLWEAISAAILAHWVETESSETPVTKATLAELRLLFGDRNMQAEILKAGIADNSELGLAIAKRTGTDIRHDLYPRLVAGAVTTTVQIAIDAFLKASAPTSVYSLLSDALRQLQQGFPEPNRKQPTRASSPGQPASRNPLSTGPASVRYPDRRFKRCCVSDEFSAG